MATLSESGQYGIAPNGDVFDLYTGQHIDLPTFQSLGLNASLLPKIQAAPAGPNVGNDQYNAILGQLNDFLNKLKANGQTINPNVQITPDKIAEFTNLAKNQIHPYYATQLKAATDKFLTGLGYSTQDLQNSEKQAQTKYSQDLRTLQANEAEKGFALSGERNLAEQNLATATQDTLDKNRRTLGENAFNSASTFAQSYGGANVPTSPTLGAAPRVIAGNPTFDTSGQNSSLYQLSPDTYQSLIGSEQNAEQGATQNLASDLTKNYTTTQANNQTRNLTF